MKNSTKIVPIRAFKDNYIWTIVDEKNNTCCVVDPGDAIPVSKFLKENNLTLSGILLTHHHADHSGGVKKLLSQFAGIPVYGSHLSKIEAVNKHVKEGDVIDCMNMQFKVMEIPGHTLDHIAFYNDEILFCGDTVFSAGCGKVFEGTTEQMYQSLQKILNLSEKIKMYCGHEYTMANLMFAQEVEPNNSEIKSKITSIQENADANVPTLPSTILAETRINPFFRCDEPDVIKAVEAHANQALKGASDVFAHLRDWKNNYK